MVPNIRLHTNTMERMFSKEGKPRLNDIRVAILNLNKSTKRYSLEILLGLLVSEIAFQNSPAFRDSRERCRSESGKIQIVCRSERKVGEKLDMSCAV